MIIWNKDFDKVFLVKENFILIKEIKVIREDIFKEGIEEEIKEVEIEEIVERLMTNPLLKATGVVSPY